MPLADVSVANVVRPLVDLDSRLEPTVTNVTFLKDVATNKDIRDASVECQQTLSEHDVKAAMRVDVYQRVAAIMASPEQLGGQALTVHATPHAHLFAASLYFAHALSLCA